MVYDDAVYYIYREKKRRKEEKKKREEVTVGVAAKRPNRSKLKFLIFMVYD